MVFAHVGGDKLMSMIKPAIVKRGDYWAVTPCGDRVAEVRQFATWADAKAYFWDLLEGVKRLKAKGFL